MVIFLHSHSYLLAGYPQGSYSHGHRLALPGPARDHARKAPSMAAGGDNQKLVRIFDQAHRSAGLTASAAKCFFGNHGILGDIFAYAALVPTRSRQDIPMFLGDDRKSTRLNSSH